MERPTIHDIAARLQRLEVRLAVIERALTPGHAPNDPASFGQVAERLRNIEYRFQTAMVRLERMVGPLNP